MFFFHVKNPGRFEKLALAGELGHGHFDVVLHSFWIPHGDEHAVGCLGGGLAQYMTQLQLKFGACKAWTGDQDCVYHRTRTIGSGLCQEVFVGND